MSVHCSTERCVTGLLGEAAHAAAPQSDLAVAYDLVGRRTFRRDIRFQAYAAQWGFAEVLLAGRLLELQRRSINTPEGKHHASSHGKPHRYRSGGNLDWMRHRLRVPSK